MLWQIKRIGPLSVIIITISFSLKLISVLQIYHLVVLRALHSYSTPYEIHKNVYWFLALYANTYFVYSVSNTSPSATIYWLNLLLLIGKFKYRVSMILISHTDFKSYQHCSVYNWINRSLGHHYLTISLWSSIHIPTSTPIHVTVTFCKFFASQSNPNQPW